MIRNPLYETVDESWNFENQVYKLLCVYSIHHNIPIFFVGNNEKLKSQGLIGAEFAPHYNFTEGCAPLGIKGEPITSATFQNRS